jgi:hypothetical protein
MIRIKKNFLDMPDFIAYIDVRDGFGRHRFNPGAPPTNNGPGFGMPGEEGR